MNNLKNTNGIKYVYVRNEHELKIKSLEDNVYFTLKDIDHNIDYELHCLSYKIDALSKKLKNYNIDNEFEYSNGSYCGNDFASEKYMGRKLYGNHFFPIIVQFPSFFVISYRQYIA